ncbi:MAG: holo-ACP synthase [Rhodoluna sp.]
MIVGVGVDLVDVARFESKLNQTSGLTERLFTSEEIGSKGESLAGYWAAKEALIKALGNPTGLSFQDVQVVKDDLGKPRLEVSGATEIRAAELRISAWHLSISHDAGMAVAVVIAEGAN